MGPWKVWGGSRELLGVSMGGLGGSKESGRFRGSLGGGVHGGSGGSMELLGVGCLCKLRRGEVSTDLLDPWRVRGVHVGLGGSREVLEGSMEGLGGGCGAPGGVDDILGVGST